MELEKDKLFVGFLVILMIFFISFEPQIRSFQTNNKEAENNNERILPQELEKVSINKLNQKSVELRNIGRTPLNLSKVSIYISDDIVKCEWLHIGLLQPLGIAECKFDQVCNEGQKLRVTLLGSFDEIAC